MRVGYRRLSGAIGLSDKEAGTRGMWWEKRRALLAELVRRGHAVHLASRLTKESAPMAWGDHDGPPYDLLVVEFAGLNLRFFGDDIAETIKIIEAHDGPVVFLCDDPDLWFPWGRLPLRQYMRWKILVNSPLTEQPVPSNASVLDAPFASLQPMLAPVPAEDERFAYVGRLEGRVKVFKQLVAGQAPFQVYGRGSEWGKLGVSVLEAPAQPQRAAFYARRLGALAVTDRRHKELRWRTGRAYHAISAGCPVVAEAGHPVLASTFARFTSADDLRRMAAQLRDPAERVALVLEQQERAARDRAAMAFALDECGL